MADRYTFIAVPEDLEDPIIVKRFLDKLIEQLDIAFNNRGDGGFVTGQALSDTASLPEIINKINNLKEEFVTKIDGLFTNTARYNNIYEIVGETDIVHKDYVEKNTTKNDKQPAISNVVAGADDPASIVNNRNKINQILAALKSSDILS